MVALLMAMQNNVYGENVLKICAKIENMLNFIMLSHIHRDELNFAFLVLSVEISKLIRAYNNLYVGHMDTVYITVSENSTNIVYIYSNLIENIQINWRASENRQHIQNICNYNFTRANRLVQTYMKHTYKQIYIVFSINNYISLISFNFPWQFETMNKYL